MKWRVASRQPRETDDTSESERGRGLLMDGNILIRAVCSMTRSCPSTWSVHNAAEECRNTNVKEDAAETGFQNGSGQIGGEKLYVPASVIPLGSGT